MTLLRNTAEGGTHGVAVDSTNSAAGGHPFDMTTNVTYSTDAAVRGSLGYQYTLESAGTAQTGWDNTSFTVSFGTAAPTMFWGRVYFRFETNPPAITRLAQISSTVPEVQWGIALNTDGKIGIRNVYASPDQWEGSLSTSALATGTWHRLEYQAKWNASTDQWTVVLRMFTGTNVHGFSPSYTLSPAAFSGTVDHTPGRWTFGALNGTITWSVRMDEPAITTATWLGPVAATSGGGAGEIGAYLDPTKYGYTAAQMNLAIADWEEYSGRPLACHRHFFGHHAMPADLASAGQNGINVLADIQSGRTCLLSLKPCMYGPDGYTAPLSNAPEPSFTVNSQADLNAKFESLLADIYDACLPANGGHGTDKVLIDLWQEPHQLSITSATQFIGMFQNYASLIHEYGFKAVFCTAASDVWANNENAMFPGAAYCDEVATDWYYPQYGDTAPPALHPLGSGTSQDAAKPADDNDLPFSLYEFNSSTGPNEGCTEDQAKAYWGYLLDYMLIRRMNGRDVNYLAVFNSDSGSENPRDSQIICADGEAGYMGVTEYRNAFVAAMADGLTEQTPVTPASVSCTASVPSPVISSSTIVAPVSVAAAVSIPVLFAARDYVWQGTNFGLSAPEGSAVLSVTVTVRHHESAVSDFESISGQIYISGSPVGSAQVFTLSATDRADEVTVTSGISQADLPNIAVRVTSHALTSTATESIDWAQAKAEYIPPTSVSIYPDPVTVSATAQIPSVEAGGSVQVSPSLITVAVSVPAPDIIAGSTLALSLVTASAVVPSPIIGTGATATLDTVQATAVVPYPDIIAESTVTPDAVNAIGSIPIPDASADSTVTPAVISAAVAVPAPFVSYYAIWQGTDFGLSVPAGSVVVSVTISVRHHETSDVDYVAGQVYISGTPIGSATEFTRSETDRTDGVTVTSGIGVDDIPNLAVRVTSRIATPNAIEYIDWAQAEVEYIPPTSVTVYPEPVACAVVVPDALVQTEGSATASPACVACAAEVYEPLVLTAQSATAEPGSVACTAAVYQPTVTVNVQITPGVVAAGANIPSPGILIGSEAITPAAVAAIAAVSVPFIQTEGSVTVAPASVAATVTVPTPALATDAKATPGTVTASASVSTPTASVSVLVTPAAVAATATVPSPALTWGTNAAPAMVTATVIVPAPGIMSGQSILISPSCVALIASVPTPAAHMDAAIFPVSVTASAEVGSPVPSAGSTVTPACVATITEILGGDFKPVPGKSYPTVTEEQVHETVITAGRASTVIITHTDTSAPQTGGQATSLPATEDEHTHSASIS